MTDIDLGNEEWEPIGYTRNSVPLTISGTAKDITKCYFCGKFDGGIYDSNNELAGTHKVSNLKVTYSGTPVNTKSANAHFCGLFGWWNPMNSSDYFFKNLTIENVNIQGYNYCGAFFGGAVTTGDYTVDNLHLTGTININGRFSFVGGIAGDVRGNMSNCTVDADGTGTIHGYYNVGGIAGYIGTTAQSGTTVTGSSVQDVAVSAYYDYNVGAIAGFANDVVISNNTVSAVAVSATAIQYSEMGILVGASSATDDKYLVVADNTVVSSTASANGTPVTTQVGSATTEHAIVGSNVAFDESGKVKGGIFENIPASAIASGYITTDNPDTDTNASYPLTIDGPFVAVIYDSDTGKFKKGFETLADALSGAADGETITLISGPDKAISAKGEVTGGKTVTITGTAKFDWAPGWLFVGRGANAGDGTLIFKDATITRSSNQASYGLHISGKNKSSSTTNYGTLIITNSTIECDVLINKGSITVYGKDPSVDVPDFEVFNGWGVGGRPASESVSGEHETATFTATDGAYIRLADHNGQGNGYEGNAVMSILNGSRFEYTGASFANGDNCTDGATGVINVDATSLLKMKAFQNLDNGNSSVVIDATGAAGSSKVIDLSGTKSLEGYVTVNNLVAPMTAIYDADGDVTLMSVAAIVNDSSDALVGRYETLAEAVENYQDGYTIVVVDKTQTIPEGWMFKESGNVTTLVKAVAQIGTTKYETLAEAIEELSDGDTLMVLADVTYNDFEWLEVNCIVDLDGHTLTFGDQGLIFIDETYEVVFANGSIASTLVSGDASAPISCAGYEDEGEYTHPRLILDNVAIQSVVTPVDVRDGGVLVVSNSTITVTGVGANTGIGLGSGGMATLGAGTVLSAAKTGVNVDGGTLVVDGGAISGGVVGINIEADSSVSVLAGSVTGGEDGIEIWGNGNAAEAPELSISGGTVIGTAHYGVTGNGTIDNNNDYSETVVTIDGGVISGGIAGIYNPQKGSLAISGCTVEGADAAVWAKSGSTAISGGAFKATSGSALLVEAVDYPGGNPEVAVSGGVFSSAVPGEYCADGYSPADNTDAATSDAYPYTVISDNEAQIVRGGAVIQKGTLAEMIAESEPGDTVTLLKDVTTSEIVYVDKSITLDGDGHKLITSAARGIRVTTANVDVTIKNLEIPYNSNVKRGIQMDSDRDDVSLTLENVKAAGTDYAVVVIAGSDRPALTLKNVELTAKYPVHIAIVDNPTLVIQNSQLEGYCAMELYGNEGTVTIEDSTLVGVNNATYDARGWNDYGVIVIEGDTTGQTQNGASRYDITVKNTAIVVDSTNGNGQRAILYNINSAENAITLENCTVEFKNENCTFLCDNGAESVTKLKGTTVYGTENIPDLPEGYCYVDDGEYKLVAKAVAQIGNTGYASLADAIAAVPTDGTLTTITMIADEAVVAGVTIAAGQNVVLELNGKTISGNTDSTKQYALITNKGTLTIQDNTDTNGDGTGTGLITTYISNPDTGDVPGYASNTISNYGKLTVKSGKIVNNGSGYACYAIDNQTNGNQYEPELDIQGGRMVQMNAYTYAVRLFCNSTTKENKATISGGVIEGGYGLWVQTPNANANKATLTISGGTLNANDGAALYVGGTKADNSNISIVITDGEINGTGAMIQGPLSGTYKKVEISGGDIVNVQCGANVEDFISGGTFDNPVNEAYCADGYIPTDNGNGTYGVKQGNYVAQLMGDGYVAISANIDEPSEDVYLDMWSFWGMEGMVDANNNECPQYVSITDETLYRDTAVADANGDEAWVSAKYLYENYLASGKKYYASQTSLLYEEGEVIVAKFESLTEAVAAVQDNETIQLLTNITLTAGVEVVKAQGGTFVLDGAGYTITAASPLSNSKIIAVYIEGKASDASAMQLDVKNLTIESDGLKYGFVLDSMQVAMSNVVVRANGGTAFCANTHASVTIDDCTIANTGSHTESWRDTALAVSYMADVTVNSGTVTSENGWAAYIFTSGGTIDVKGGTFSGKVRSSADTVGENRGDATITISGGEFSNVELTTAHDSNLNATIAVSGGWFSAQVPAMACAEGFEPTGALADAPNAAVPYTVGYAADIIYPIEGTDGVPIALAWATNNTSVVSEGAPVTAADVPNIITALGENGANNMPRWQSYVLGLNPADATAVLRLGATAKDATTVTITGSVDTTKFPSISNVTVTFRLAAQNGAEWTDIATGAAAPSFDVSLDDVAGKVLTIFADIVTE